jgi:hypothetical protein
MAMGKFPKAILEPVFAPGISLRLDIRVRSQLGQRMHGVDAESDEPLPKRFQDLLKQLEARTQRGV